MPRARTVFGLATAFAVCWLGGLILGEYPFTGFTPVIGGFLLGVSAVSAAAHVEGEDPPAWAIVAAGLLAVWGIWRAAWIDAGADNTAFGMFPQHGSGPLPNEATWAMVAAAAGAAIRLIPAPQRAAADPDDAEDDPQD